MNNTDIEIARLVFDFGMLVLIWLVQLVIYPSFKFYEKNNLKQWHKRYVMKIAYVVMPLMIGQLSLAIVQVFMAFTLYSVSGLILIVLVWISTFFYFVPMHNSISFGDTDTSIWDRLIRNNWLRTILLTLIFLSTMLKMIF